jgi:hypothetical protein
VWCSWESEREKSREEAKEEGTNSMLENGMEDKDPWCFL